MSRLDALAPQTAATQKAADDHSFSAHNTSDLSLRSLGCHAGCLNVSSISNNGNCGLQGGRNEDEHWSEQRQQALQAAAHLHCAHLRAAAVPQPCSPHRAVRRIVDTNEHGVDPRIHLALAIHTALPHVRYAINGHLALSLHALVHNVAGAGIDDDLIRATPADEGSADTRVSIVCPVSTRDVLPSWSAAASPQRFFYDARNIPNQLELIMADYASGTITVHIDWVEDGQFDTRPSSPGTDSGKSHTTTHVPVLSLWCLLHLAADAYASEYASDAQGDPETRHILGRYVMVCLALLNGTQPADGFRLRDKAPVICDAAFYEPFFAEFESGADLLLSLAEKSTDVRSRMQPGHNIPRKPLPAGSRSKPLPPLPSWALS